MRNKTFSAQQLSYFTNSFKIIEGGLTAIELLITLTIVAILVSLATPSLTNMTSNNRISSSFSELATSLKLARTEALSRQSTVIFCGTENGETCAEEVLWRSGYMIFFDEDGLGKPVDNEENQALIQLVQKKSNDTFLQLSGPKRHIRFSSTGDALDFNGVLSVCDKRGEKFARGIIVTPVGMIRAAIDSDGDGIINVSEQENVSC